MNLSKKFLQELVNYGQLRVLPALLAKLPHSLAWNLSRRAVNLGLYNRQVNLANKHAISYLALEDNPNWIRQAQHHILADHSDYFLTGKSAELKNNPRLKVLQNGLSGYKGLAPTLIMTFHWGQGFWLLRYLRSQGFHPAWLHAPVKSESSLGSYVEAKMGRVRIRKVAEITGAEPIATGNAVQTMKEYLKDAKHCVIAMPDAPLAPGRSSIQVKFLGKLASWPAGLITMAAEEQLEVSVATCGLNTQSGEREIRITKPLRYQDAQSLAQQLAIKLEEHIKIASSAWYVWPHVESFFQNAESQIASSNLSTENQQTGNAAWN